MPKPPAKAGADSGWNVVVGRRGRAAAAAARGASNGASTEKEEREQVEADEDQERGRDASPRPSRPSSSRAPRPRPRSRVVADLVSSVRDCEREVFGSRAWRSLVARLEESEEDFFAVGQEEEDEEQEEAVSRKGRSSEDDDGAPPPFPAAAAAAAATTTTFSFRDVSRLTVLGLGSLEASRTPRLQAALVLLLARERFPRVVVLSKEKEKKKGAEEEEGDQKRVCSLFAADPVFTEADKEALAELGFAVVAPEKAVEAGRVRRKRSNERAAEEKGEGEGEAEENNLSFFYLPHCYPPVAEEVLEAHWNREDIKRIAILGNALSAMAEKVKMRKSSSAATTTATPRCLAAGSKPKPSNARHAATVIVEASVVGPDLDAASARSGLGTAFNDTALHLFPRWTREFAEI